MNPSDIWNDRYSKKFYAYGKEANEFFKQELSKLNPGGLLLPAEGEGRNAVYAVKQGWNVVAFDQSEKAREKAMALAEENGVELEYAVADATHYLCPVMVDALCYCYFHLPAAQGEEVYARLNGFLQNGGALIFEAFSVKNIGMGSGGPQMESMLFTEEKVRALFADFANVEVWEEKVTLKEGMYHDGEAWIIRARGRK
jgi:hypothetical protein